LGSSLVAFGRSRKRRREGGEGDAKKISKMMMMMMMTRPLSCRAEKRKTSEMRRVCVWEREREREKERERERERERKRERTLPDFATAEMIARERKEKNCANGLRKLLMVARN
jgi:hypothetical protein